MKIRYSVILAVMLSVPLFSQTLKVVKNDQSVIDFKLAQIDSITFSTVQQSNLSESPDKNNNSIISEVKTSELSPVSDEKITPAAFFRKAEEAADKKSNINSN